MCREGFISIKKGYYKGLKYTLKIDTYSSGIRLNESNLFTES